MAARIPFGTLITPCTRCRLRSPQPQPCPAQPLQSPPGRGSCPAESSRSRTFSSPLSGSKDRARCSMGSSTAPTALKQLPCLLLPEPCCPGQAGQWASQEEWVLRGLWAKDAGPAGLQPCPTALSTTWHPWLPRRKKALVRLLQNQRQEASGPADPTAAAAVASAHLPDPRESLRSTAV